MRIETESRQTNKTGGKYINWQELIREGGVLPLPEDDNWRKFERTFRQWYKTSVKHDNGSVKAENKFYYDYAKDHVEKTVGYKITEIPHTGSIEIMKPSKWLADGEIEGEIEHHVEYEMV